ncbi:hypothetical protein ONZ45_g1850 [Pleurotus djamor]|nr:hypothetical protein ONZ45_g1850 [Pleurotus djamor]
MSTHIKPESFGNFDLVRKLKLDFTDVVVSKWRSRVTGLSIVHLDYEAPLVNGYFVVATEMVAHTHSNSLSSPPNIYFLVLTACNDSLVFMGSQKYPYKGIIDHFANRGFSNGTNAWTDDDHTAYTVSTAGGQGFLQLLPIYVDHILYPTLTKAGFVTEVHHIDPKGHDSGVVYSEMQGRENTAGDLMALRTQRLLEPPESAYRSETGGLMEALRVLTVEQIREYHGTYYVPHNLVLIVTGRLSGGTESLLKVVQEEVEPSIIEHKQDKGPRPDGWKRPFVETASANRQPIPKPIQEVVEFPEKDESVGELQITYLGPPVSEFLERKALDLLGNYLTSSAAAPLNKEYIEIESPLCSYIYFSEDTRATMTNLPIYIGSVPTEHLETFRDKLLASFRRIASEGINLRRMSMVIDRDERQLRSKLESTKGDTFSTTIITDFLYGKEDGSDLHDSMDEINQYATLRKWTSDQWIGLLSKYFIDAASVAVCGKPSASLAKKLETDEKARLVAQVKRLGPEGLKKATKELEDAKAEHEKPIPSEVLTSFPVPDPKSIAWIPVQSVQQAGVGRELGRAPTSLELAKHIDADGSPLPFFVQYDHVQSNFVTVHAYMSLKTLPNHLRPLVSTYLSAFYSLPVQTHTGETLNHEDVVNRLDNETVSYEVGLGISSLFSELLYVSIQVEAAQYDTAVAWIKDLVYGMKFDQERLQVIVAKIQQSLPELKRDGNTVLNSLWGDIMYDDASTSRAGGVLSQTEYIPALAKRLQDSPEEVIAEFEGIRKHLTNPSGVRFSVTGNVLSVEQPRQTFAKYFSPVLPETPLSPVPLASQTLSELGQTPSRKAVVMSLPTIQSSYVMHTTKGLLGFDHPEYPAVRVAMEVLNATEGFLWRYIRGSGLAYGAYTSIDLEAGFMTFSLYRSSNAIGAFDEASKVVNGLIDGSVELDDASVDAAKSSVVFGVANNVSTASRAALVSFANQAIKNIPQRHNVDLLEKYQKVTKEEVLEALQKHFLPLFRAESSIAVVVTAPSKSETICEGLRKHGFDVETKALQLGADELEAGGESGSEEDSDSD